MKQWVTVISILLMSLSANHCWAQEVPLDLQPEHQQIVKEDIRYLRICTRNDLDYFLDQATAKKIRHPYLKEDLWDIWLKIKENENAAYTYPEVYTMEHYYVRLIKPELQRMQRIQMEEESALEYVLQTPFQEKNWKILIPGSIEEEIYWAIIKNVKQN